LWQRTYGTAPDELNSGSEFGIDVAVAPDNSGVVVLGNYRDGNIFLAKFSTEGAVIWDLTWGGNQEGATAVAIAPDGTIYVTGATFDFGAGQSDAFLLSFTPTGTLNWQRTWGGDFFDVARGVAVATDGNIYITGDTGNSAFLVKFFPDGTVGVQREWGIGVSGRRCSRGPCPRGADPRRPPNGPSRAHERARPAGRLRACH
jgi:outer membrane protein assembly factor BamB